MEGVVGRASFRTRSPAGDLTAFRIDPLAGHPTLAGAGGTP